MIGREKSHWKNLLNRILSIINYLTIHYDVLRGTTDVVYAERNISWYY